MRSASSPWSAPVDAGRTADTYEAGAPEAPWLPDPAAIENARCAAGAESRARIDAAENPWCITSGRAFTRPPM